MSLRRRLLSATLLCLGCSTVRAQDLTPLPHGSDYIEREFRIHVPGSDPNGLDVLEVFVNTPVKHPLALLTHGTSNNPAERAQLSAWSQLPQALWFARRGYVALVIIRRGYGTSTGVQDSVDGGCRPGGSFEDSGRDSADDLRNTVLYAAKHMPEVDTTRVISIGVSTGGFAQVALAAYPPPGLRAAISFAGGRGGDGKGELCAEAPLLDAFKAFGRRSHTPMLWIYAQNDKWFPPPLAKKFEQAFQSGGGTDVFVQAPPYGDDGHQLYAHVAAWPPAIDAFLWGHSLQPLRAPYPLPTVPKVDPPPGLHINGLEGFQNFIKAGANKAFATNGQSIWGSSAGELSQSIADQHALENCEKNRHGGWPCVVVARTKPE